MSRLPKLRFLSVVVAVLTTAFLLPPIADAGQPKPRKASPVAGSAEKEVAAAIADAIGTLEEPDYQQFYEHYAPVGILQAIRREKGGVTAFANRIAKKKSAAMLFRSLLGRLRKAQKVKPVFNKEETIARLEFILQPARKLKPAELPFGTVKKKITVKGYGRDLGAVLDNARAALDARDHAEFLARMLPVTQLQRNDVGKLAKRLKSSPAVVKQMVADLKLVQNETPKFEQKGTVAVFRIKRPQTNVAGRQVGIKLPDRVFKFQKVGGHWRLYDNTKELISGAATAKTRTIPAVRGALVMEKFRDHWRISMFDPRVAPEWYKFYRQFRLRDFDK